MILVLLITEKVHWRKCIKGRCKSIIWCHRQDAQTPSMPPGHSTRRLSTYCPSHSDVIFRLVFSTTSNIGRHPSIGASVIISNPCTAMQRTSSRGGRSKEMVKNTMSILMRANKSEDPKASMRGHQPNFVRLSFS